MCKTFLIATAVACMLSAQQFISAESNTGGFKSFSTIDDNRKFIDWNMNWLMVSSVGDLKSRSSDECQVTPVIHVLQYPGCVPKPIPSFACIGRCSSYLQVNDNELELCARWNQLILKTEICLDGFDCSLCRYQEAKSGKWSDHACVVRNRAKEKRPYRYSVPKQSLANVNFVR